MKEFVEYKTIRCEELQVVSKDGGSIALICTDNDRCSIVLNRKAKFGLVLGVKDDMAIVAICRELPNIELCLSLKEDGQIQLAPTARLQEILQSPNVVEAVESMLDEELPEKVEEIVTTLHERSRGL